MSIGLQQRKIATDQPQALEDKNQNKTFLKKTNSGITPNQSSTSSYATKKA
jgi:hypothetical protein